MNRETKYPVWDIEALTVENKDYRHVLYTGDRVQIVLMNLLPFQEIGRESHQAEQFIKVEDGSGWVQLRGNKYELYPGVAALIPPLTFHNVKAGSKGLKIYTIYSPPQHPMFTVERIKVDE